MRNQYINLSEGRIWIQRTNIQGEESITFRFDNNTVIDDEVLDAIRKYGAWNLYCGDFWSGRDFSVFRPVMDVVKKLTYSAERSTKILGLDSLVYLESTVASGDVSGVDFTKLTRLATLSISHSSRGGNWHYCEALENLILDIALPSLRKLNALQRLRSLSCCRGLKSFDGIADLPALEELRLGACHLPTLETIGHRPNLRLLLLNLMPKLETLQGLEGLPNLEVLDVTQCGGLRDVSAISSLTKLKRLTLAFCPRIASLNGITLPADCQVDFVPKGKIGDGF